MKNTIKTLFLIFTFIICLISCTNKSNKVAETPTLKSSYADNFYIGAAINDNQILETDTLAIKIIEEQFSTISPENIMKWMYMEPEQNKFDFEMADKYVALGEKNNMFIVGHTLVWHSQLADWVEKINDSTALANSIENHITTIVSKYKGRINTWDVVNEALNEDGTLRESHFYKVLGERFIEQAFKAAAKADPEAELIYNDYNMWKPAKRAGAVRLVKQLQANGAKIDGIGMQAHWGLDSPSLEDIENSIIAYAELGLKVSFTELDVTALPNPWDLDGAAVEQSYAQFEGDPKMNPFPVKLTDSAQTQLAERYETIFKLFLKHKDKISRVTFWGVTDKQSWLNDWPINGRTNHPLLFDRNYQPKKAYNSVMALKQHNNN